MRTKSLLPKSGYVWAISITVLIAGIMRLWRLDTLPPGLATGEAQIGLAAYALSHNAVWPTFSSVGAQSPLLVVLEASSQRVFGLDPWVLRIVPALLGTVAVYVLYLWGKSWFGPRNGLIAAVLLATSSWSITISRNIQPAALAPLLLILCLWLGTRLWYKKSLSSLLAFIAVVGLTSYAGIVGWAVLVVVAGVGAVAALSSHVMQPRMSLLTVWVAVTALALAPATILAIIHQPDLGLAKAGELGSQASNVAQAFLFHGDESFQANLGGQPLLNVFMGIMATAGILVSATRLSERKYRLLAVMSILSVIPALISAGPFASAGRLSLALVPASMLASIGIAYMLEIWYITFPINSAARLTGQSVIIILLVLSTFQGFTQYFTAWAGSSSTQVAFNDRAVALGKWAIAQPTGSALVLIANPKTKSSLDYVLLRNNHKTTIVTSEQAIAAVISARPLRLAADIQYRVALVAALRTGAAGNSLRAHVSSFDQSELYYTYEFP